jgi:predicted RNase H-like HicB family nuclease
MSRNSRWKSGATTSFGGLTVRSPSIKMALHMKKSLDRLKIVFRPEPEGGFTASVPLLQGCVTYGRTLAEAKEMAKDAISGYIGSLKKHRDSA